MAPYSEFGAGHTWQRGAISSEETAKHFVPRTSATMILTLQILDAKTHENRRDLLGNEEEKLVALGKKLRAEMEVSEP